jgi:DNA-binding transcriptional regulator YhcF (GntR family)
MICANTGATEVVVDIEIDPLSSVPIYQQLRDRLVEGIAAGELGRGDGLASVRSLAGAFGINPATVVKAYDLLRAEGFVATNAKSGSFVVRDRESGEPDQAVLELWTARLKTLLAEGRARGLSPAQILGACQQIVDGLERRREFREGEAS